MNFYKKDLQFELLNFVTDQGEGDGLEHSLGGSIEDIWTVPGTLWAEPGSSGKKENIGVINAKMKYLK